jgi:putative PIN family toxin of toxin-antitoxin system
MRAVFDTNVVISALVFGRRLNWLRRAWASGAVIPVVCRETAAELLRVLSYPKFRLDATEREILLADYLPFAETAVLPEPLPVLPAACRDRDDAVFLHLAVASRAELLVSGDSDLTLLADAHPIASPETLRQLLGIEIGSARLRYAPR